MPQNQTYNIEFSHIYADKNFAEVQHNSAKFLEELMNSWNFSYSTVALIDNYNVVDDVLDKDQFLAELNSRDMLPNFWAYEGDMTQYADTLLGMINDKKMKSRYEDYINKKQKYPCSFLTAIWYFIRLGVIDGGDLLYSTRNEVDFAPSDRLINILPKDFKEVEQTTFQLIKSTNRAELTNRIQNLFHQTQLIKDKFRDDLV